MLHKPSLKMKELWGVRNGLAKAICSVLLRVASFDVVQCVGGRSRMCVSYA
jgi:hypothetical protein